MRKFSKILTAITVTLLICILGTVAAILVKLYCINPSQSIQPVTEKIFHYSVEHTSVEGPIKNTPNAVVIDEKIEDSVVM